MDDASQFRCPADLALHIRTQMDQYAIPGCMGVISCCTGRDVFATSRGLDAHNCSRLPTDPQSSKDNRNRMDRQYTQPCPEPHNYPEILIKTPKIVLDKWKPLKATEGICYRCRLCQAFDSVLKKVCFRHLLRVHGPFSRHRSTALDNFVISMKSRLGYLSAHIPLIPLQKWHCLWNEDFICLICLQFGACCHAQMVVHVTEAHRAKPTSGLTYQEIPR